MGKAMVLALVLTVGVLTVVGLLPGAAFSKARTRTVRCCITIDIPGVTPGAVCTPINFNVRPRRFATKRFCTLIGGAAPVDGACSCPE